MAMKKSEGGNYIIFTNDQHSLYVNSRGKPNIHPWLSLVSSEAAYSDGGVYYYQYIYNHEITVNDCLQFSESLTIGIPNYSKPKCILKEKGSSLAFGSTDRQNIEIALRRGEILNEVANPGLGESYAIVRQKVVGGKAPYHIGYVLFKDGNTNITIEVDAGDIELTHPIFDMYDVRPETGKTFHDQYKNMYKPASTVVLTKR